MFEMVGGRSGRRSTPPHASVLGLLALVALVIGAVPLGSLAARQDSPDAADGPIVGLGSPGEIAFAFVGRIERRNSSVTVYGFLTQVAGLAADELFADPASPSAESARFTLFGTAEPEPRVALDGVEVATAAGELAVYYNPGAGASFGAAESFFSGTRVALGPIRLHDVLVGDPGEERTVDSFAVYELTESAPLTLETGVEVRFGEPEARLHVLGSGVEPPAEEGSSRTATTFAGRAFVALSSVATSPSATDEPAPNATPDEETDPVASTPDADVDCAAIESWLAGTLGRVARTRALVTLVVAVLADEEGDPFTALEPEGLRAAADELNELADAQAAAEAPADVEAADRTLVESFQTFARGLNLLATAVANENTAALDQARALIDDANVALTEGSQPLAELAGTCGFRS